MAKEKEKDPKGNEEEIEKKEGEEQAEGEGAEAAPKKKKLTKKMLIIIGVGAFLLLGGVVGATLFFMGVFDKKPAVEGEAHAAGAATAQKAPEKDGKIFFFALGDLLVNLSGEGKRPNFLKVKISLELADEKDAAALEALKPRIIDNFQVYLRELRIEDLRGSAGMYRLREALLLRVTEVAAPVRIRDVLFQEMLVQ